MFVLARDLGMTVAELGARMSGAELTEWAAFFELENEDRKRAELREAAVAGVQSRMKNRRTRR